MKKIPSTIFLLISLGVLILSACTSPISAVKNAISKPEPTNILTGLPGSNGPVLAVKIDDTPAAHPQIGLEKADVVYIEQVEGGLTRLAAIYSQYPGLMPNRIGPVRSARISDLDILAQYGKVGFAFSGAQSKFYPKINAANLQNLSADREPASIYSRDESRYAPTNLILDGQALLAKSIDQEKLEIDTVKSVGWNFGEVSTDSKWLSANGVQAISEADLNWPASSYQVIWSNSAKKWLINYEHKPNLVADGSQLMVSTFVIQMVQITDSEYRDKLGGVTPLSKTVGTGTAYLLRDGKAFPMTWSRATETDGTHWSFLDGSEAKFAPSQIWVALTDRTPGFIYPAAPTPTK